MFLVLNACVGKVLFWVVLASPLSHLIYTQFYYHSRNDKNQKWPEAVLLFARCTQVYSLKRQSFVFNNLSKNT